MTSQPYEFVKNCDWLTDGLPAWHLEVASTRADCPTRRTKKNLSGQSFIHLFTGKLWLVSKSWCVEKMLYWLQWIHFRSNYVTDIPSKVNPLWFQKAYFSSLGHSFLIRWKWVCLFKGVVPLIFPRRMCILDNQGNTLVFTGSETVKN